MKRVYIAGPMTGIEWFNRPAFYKKAKELEIAGFEAVHTADMPLGLSYETYMSESFKRLEGCDYVLLLPGWQKSRGAKREIAFAKKYGKRIVEDLAELREFAEVTAYGRS